MKAPWSSLILTDSQIDDWYHHISTISKYWWNFAHCDPAANHMLHHWGQGVESAVQEGRNQRDASAAVHETVNQRRKHKVGDLSTVHTKQQEKPAPVVQSQAKSFSFFFYKNHRTPLVSKLHWPQIPVTHTCMHTQKTAFPGTNSEWNHWFYFVYFCVFLCGISVVWQQTLLVPLLGRITFVLSDLSLSLFVPVTGFVPFNFSTPLHSSSTPFIPLFLFCFLRKKMNGCMQRWGDPRKGGVLRLDCGDGCKRGCLSNHIAEPVPEHYRFTLPTIQALLVMAQPLGWGHEEKWEGRGSHIPVESHFRWRKPLSSKI